MRDSGYMVNDKGYRDQVLAEIRKLGVNSVEERAKSGLAISIYGSDSHPVLEIFKALPGSHTTDAAADGLREDPNYREVQVTSSPGKFWGTNSDLTIWDNDDKVTK
jgi:hypothetical protein